MADQQENWAKAIALTLGSIEEQLIINNLIQLARIPGVHPTTARMMAQEAADRLDPYVTTSTEDNDDREEAEERDAQDHGTWDPDDSPGV